MAEKPNPTLADLQQIENTSVPTAGKGIVLGLDGKISISYLPIVTGQVTSAGVLASGSGFTVARTSAGRYTVTFSKTFPAQPVVIATVIATTGNDVLTTTLLSAASVQINTNDGGLAVDRAFHFVAFTTF